MNNETFRATCIGQLADLTAIVFDFGYQDKTGGSVHVDTGTAAGDFQTLVQGTLASVLPDDYTFIKYRFACVSGAHVGEIGFVDVTPAVAGSLSSSLRQPNEIAISLKRSTGYASRHDRGRVFLGPIAASLVDAGNPNIWNATATDVNAAANLLKAALVTGGVSLTPVILASSGTTLGHSIIHATPAQAFVHLRSRRPRVGG